MASLEELEKHPESKVFLSTPPVIPGLCTAGGLETIQTVFNERLVNVH